MPAQLTPRTLDWAADDQDAQQPLAAAAAAAAAERNGGDTEDEDEEEDPMPFGRTASQRRPGTITVTEGPSAQPQMAALRRRRPSLVVALSGDDEDFATRERLAQRVAIAAATLGSAEKRKSPFERGCWMPLIMSALGLSLLLAPTELLIDSEPNAWDVSDAWEEPEPEPAEFTQRFEVNEPVGAFLGVSALVYALIFVSAYGEAQSRLDEIRNSLVIEASGIHTAMLLVRTLDADNSLHKTRTLLLFSTYISQLSEEIERERGGLSTESEEDRTSIETLYAAIPFLAKIADDGDGDEMDRVLVQRTIDMLNKVSGARAIRETAMQNEHSWLTYAFLLEMGLVTFFGVLMLQAGSRALNVTMSALTGIVLLSSVVFLIDLGMPFHGFVQVDVSIFERIRKSISMVLAGVNDREQTTLWCGGIPREFVAGDLDKAAAKMRQLFEPFGRVATVTVRQKAAARGSWALVTFTNSAAIEKAMRAGVSVPSDDGQTCGLQLKKADLNVRSGGAAQQIIGKHEQVQDEVAVPGIPSVASHTFKA